jgi:type II secretory pathway pseudopilin PulG
MSTRGHTLLEAIVALGVTALVLAALGTAVLRAVAVRAQATKTADEAATRRTVLLRLAAELEAAQVPPPGPGPERFVVDAARPETRWARLRFASALPGPAAGAGPRGDVRTVLYQVEPDPVRPTTGRLVRHETAAPQPPDLPPFPSRGQALLDNVRAFEVRCFDGTRWLSEWTDEVLPRAVEVTVTLVSPDGPRTEALAVAVALPAGTG